MGCDQPIGEPMRIYRPRKAYPRNTPPREQADQKTQAIKWDASFELVEADGSELSFVVRGPTLDALFHKASEALLVATVEEADSIGDEVTYPMTLVDPQLGLLLPRFLNQLIHLRETRKLLLHARSVQLRVVDDEAQMDADLTGESIELGRHRIARDVKTALTQAPRFIGDTGGWEVLVRLTV
jgi:SHS2 domain-containing protein